MNLTCFRILLFKKTQTELIALIVNIEYENNELKIWIKREVSSKRLWLISWFSEFSEIKNLKINNIKKKGINSNLNLRYSEEKIDMKNFISASYIENNNKYLENFSKLKFNF